MKLQKQIYRINQMMGVINENKLKDLIFASYDKVFDKLRLIRTEDDLHQYDWINEDGEKIFERNDWGRLWVYGCDEYSQLTEVPKMASFDFDEFEKSLIHYLNIRYKHKFGEKRLKDIGNENCPDEIIDF